MAAKGRCEMTEIGLYHNVRRDGRNSTGLVADGDDLVEWPTPPLPEDLASLHPRLDWYLELVVPTAADVGSEDDAQVWYMVNREQDVVQPLRQLWTMLTSCLLMNSRRLSTPGR
jgi:hypothetical protein